MKGNMLQSDDVMVNNISVRKFQIDPQKFEKFAAEEVYTDSDETEEESEEDESIFKSFLNTFFSQNSPSPLTILHIFLVMHQLHPSLFTVLPSSQKKYP